MKDDELALLAASTRLAGYKWIASIHQQLPDAGTHPTTASLAPCGHQKSVVAATLRLYLSSTTSVVPLDHNTGLYPAYGPSLSFLFMKITTFPN